MWLGYWLQIMLHTHWMQSPTSSIHFFQDTDIVPTWKPDRPDSPGSDPVTCLSLSCQSLSREQRSPAADCNESEGCWKTVMHPERSRKVSNRWSAKENREKRLYRMPGKQVRPQAEILPYPRASRFNPIHQCQLRIRNLTKALDRVSRI